LDLLGLGYVSSAERVKELLSNIPTLRGLKENSFLVHPDFFDENKKLAIEAFKQNGSLEKVSNCFRLREADNANLVTMQLCCAHNKSIREWIVVPDKTKMIIVEVGTLCWIFFALLVGMVNCAILLHSQQQKQKGIVVHDTVPTSY
jgi:hypothetical protein